MTLPIRAVAPSTKPSAPVQQQSGSDLLTGLKVLVVDDDPDARELIMEALMESGAIVETAASVRQGFDAFHLFRPDVVVSDIGMPDEDGYSFVRRLRALPKNEGADVPAVALTAFAGEDDRAKALAAGYDKHVGKPVDPVVLVTVVSGLARGRRS
jgi:CheY-like chemotaxis protein